MGGSGGDAVLIAAPDEAWRALGADAATLLVDVRTRSEWTFVGAADLSGAAAGQAFIEWTQFPGGAPNPRFLEQLDEAVGEAAPRQVFFICRSGARSLAAAQAAAAHFARTGRSIACINVAEGFEGDLDGEGKRGARNGWKARRLPWRQS